MIVVDTNIIVYLFIPSQFTPKSEQLFQHDSHWVAPLIWRSEFRNVLALYLRKEILTLEQALTIQEEAESLFKDNDFEVPSSKVLPLVMASSCSAYDCEFIALAQMLKSTLYTADKRILKDFKEVVSSL